MIFGGKMPEDKQFLSPASMSVLRSVENIDRFSSSRICLFGKPDPAETAKMISDLFDSERQRVIERWGFDLFAEKLISNSNITVSKSEVKSKKNQKVLKEDKENIDLSTLNVSQNERTTAVELEDVKKSMKKSKLGDSNKKKSLKMSTEKHLRKARQSHVTDYWRSRKFSESSSCSDKEN